MMDVHLLGRSSSGCTRRLGRALLLVVKHVLSSRDWYVQLVTAGHAHFGRSVMKTTLRPDGSVVRRVLLEPENGLTIVSLWWNAHIVAPIRRLLEQQDGHGLLVHDAGKVQLLVQLCETVSDFLAAVRRGCAHVLQVAEATAEGRRLAQAHAVFARRLAVKVARLHKVCIAQRTKLSMLREFRQLMARKRSVAALLICHGELRQRMGLPPELLQLILNRAYPALPPRQLRPTATCAGGAAAPHLERAES